MSAHDTHHKSHENEKNQGNQKTGLLDKKDQKMFMELGFTASANFLPWEAHSLFGQLMLAEPEEAYPRLGLAYCKIMGGQFEDAHKLLNNEIVLSSKLKDYGMALRGLAFHLEKKNTELHDLFHKNKESLESNHTAFSFFKILLTLLP